MGLVACGATEVTPSVESPEEVVSLMADAGIGCTGFEATATDDLEQGADQQGRCEFDSEALTISTFKDAGQKQNYVGLGETLGCAMGAAFGITNISYAEGENWIVTPETQTVAEQIADAVGVESHTITCDDQ